MTEQQHLTHIDEKGDVRMVDVSEKDTCSAHGAARSLRSDDTAIGVPNRWIARNDHDDITGTEGQCPLVSTESDVPQPPLGFCG